MCVCVCVCVCVESFVPMKGFNVAENGKIIRFLVVVTIEQMLMYLVVTVSREAGVTGVYGAQAGEQNERSPR